MTTITSVTRHRMQGGSLTDQWSGTLPYKSAHPYNTGTKARVKQQFIGNGISEMISLTSWSFALWRRSPNSRATPRWTLDELGWTQEEAASIRAQFAVFAEDWDDPSMDVYDDL